MLARYEQWLQQAFENQLLLCAYLHGKRVMPSCVLKRAVCVRSPYFLKPRGGSHV